MFTSKRYGWSWRDCGQELLDWLILAYLNKLVAFEFASISLLKLNDTTRVYKHDRKTGSVTCRSVYPGDCNSLMCSGEYTSHEDCSYYLQVTQRLQQGNE